MQNKSWSFKLCDVFYETGFVLKKHCLRQSNPGTSNKIYKINIGTYNIIIVTIH